MQKAFRHLIFKGVLMLNEPRKYVNEWLRLQGVKIEPKGILDPQKRNLKELETSLFLDYCEQIAAFNNVEKDKPAKTRQILAQRSDKIIGFALADHIRITREKFKKDVIASLAYSGDSDLVTKWVKAVTGNESPEDITVMTHFIWQIKRKMRELAVIDHIMPVIFGPQGSGKTIAITKLLSPIAHYTLNFGLEEFTDSRFAVSLSNNYVAFFDELAGASKAEIGLLKRQITSSENDFRHLGTNVMDKVRNRCTCIGATNTSLDLIIKDSTGMRRFWEISSQEMTDREIINSLDYVALFKSVDETRDGGYLKELFPSIAQKQHELVSKCEVGLFVEELDLSPTKDGPTRVIKVADLYSAFQDFCKKSGIMHVPTVSVFGKKLRAFNLVRKVQKIDGKTYNVYEVRGGVLDFSDFASYFATGTIIPSKRD
jgi:hypothetical protein